MLKMLLFSPFFVLTTMCTAIVQVPSIDEVLQTNQYLLVSQQDGVTSIETSVPPGRCPHFMNKPETNHPNIRFSGAHLVRDPFGRSPPMLMTIREDDTHFNVNIFSLNVSSVLHPISRRVIRFVDKSKGFALEFSMNKQKKKILSTLFDSTSRVLYVDFSTSENFDMEQYLVTGLYTPNFNLVLLKRYHRSSPSNRFDWQEDQYAAKFYYKERIDNQVDLFEIPMSSLIPTIWEGEAGVKVGRITDNSDLLSATGGAFFTAMKKEDGDMTIFSTSLVPSNLRAGISCEIKTKTTELPRFIKLIVIRNNDYCMLKDGRNYISKSCLEQQKAYFAAQQVVEKNETDVVKWLLVACIIMFMVIVLLFVYIYWLRSSFLSENDTTHPNEYLNEASLFVAKQRSFPSGYQDPALLDVSVDKWN